MRLSQIEIENFRSIDHVVVPLDKCLVGPNGSGKPAILMALNVFFQNNDLTVTDVANLSIEDFHHRSTDKPVKITLTFEDLPAIDSEVVPKDVSDMLKLYSRQGKLIVYAKAEWDESRQIAPVKQYGSRMVMKDFTDFFEAFNSGERVVGLRTIYDRMKTIYPDLQQISTKQGMHDALREYEENRPEKCDLVEAEEQFYGFTGGRYILNQIIQWVYVPAVKDASTEQEETNKTALGQLLQRTIRSKIDFNKYLEEIERDSVQRYEKMLEQEQNALKDLGLSIEKSLRLWTNPRARLDLEWFRDAKKSIQIMGPRAKALIGDDTFIGEIARLGHGMQRGFLVSILSELAKSSETGPKLFLGFEEPELYQHPPQAQHMASVLERLTSGEGNAQIVVTTHSPYFVTSQGFECVRKFDKVNSEKRPRTKITYTTYANVNERIAKALGEKPPTPEALMYTVSQIMQSSQRELFFSSFVIFVEGIEDVGYVCSYLKLSNQWEQFRKNGGHFVVVDGKNNMSRFMAIAQELNIPSFVILDSDIQSKKERLESLAEGDSKDKLKGAKADAENNHKVNDCILKMHGIEEYNPDSSEVLWGENIVMWPKDMRATVRADFGKETWDTTQKNIIDEYGLTGNKTKNGMLISGTLTRLYKKGEKSASLEKLCSNILSYAERALFYS